MVQTRSLVGIAAGLGVLGLAVTQMGFHAQDRQYKKTLQYMHDGREKIAGRMNQMADVIDPNKPSPGDRKK